MISKDNTWLTEGFAQIPTCVAICTSLTYQSRQLYTILCVYSMNNKLVDVSQPQLAVDMGFSKDSKLIKKYILELENAKLIEVNRCSNKIVFKVCNRDKAKDTPVVKQFLIKKLI